MALVGGVNLYTHPSKYVDMCQAGMLSPTGRCHTFSNTADGFVPGEGVVSLVLKPLDAAVADADHIWGVVKGTAVNHGGTTSGYTVPNPVAQADLIRKAIGAAGIEPSRISYVEAHGTGTLLGDPVEITGLANALGTEHGKKSGAIGSVKSNIGHLEAAAGLAGIVKILLQLRHRQLAPTLHCDVLNPNIDFDACPFEVQRSLGEWHSPEGSSSNSSLRVAAISSFGAGGSNAHAILEEWPDRVQRFR